MKRTRPIQNKKGIVHISPTNQKVILKANAKHICPMNLHNATTSYFSFSSFGIVLKPAIRKWPLPSEKMMPNRKNNRIQAVMIISFSPLRMKHYSIPISSSKISPFVPENCRVNVVSFNVSAEMSVNGT